MPASSSRTLVAATRAVATPATAAVPLASRATSLAPPQPRDVPEVARRAPILALALTLTLSQP